MVWKIVIFLYKLFHGSCYLYDRYNDVIVDLRDLRTSKFE